MAWFHCIEQVVLTDDDTLYLLAAAEPSAPESEHARKVREIHVALKRTEAEGFKWIRNVTIMVVTNVSYVLGFSYAYTPSKRLIFFVQGGTLAFVGGDHASAEDLSSYLERSKNICNALFLKATPVGFNLGVLGTFSQLRRLYIGRMDSCRAD